MMTADTISLVVFAACYTLFIFFPKWRSRIACAGAAVLVLTGAITWRAAVFEKINWNVMGLFFGTLLLAEFFMLSRVPAFLAEWLVDRTATARTAMLVLCAFAGLISACVENVAVVLLVAPVALSLAEKVKMNPVPLLVGIAVSSNLQGTATMIGDSPSMILAGHQRMDFFDFFWYHGRPSIFFAVEIGALASLLVLALLFRRARGPVEIVPVEQVRSWVPTVLLGLLMLGLAVATVFDPEFTWYAGTLALGLAAVGLTWYRLVARWGGLSPLVRELDWDTPFFLMGVFVLVGTLSDSGWLDRLATLLSGAVGASPLAAFVLIVLLAVVVSGFVDNIPFLIAMLPVAEKVARSVHAPVPLIMFGLLVGACLGGNVTPLGASANVVTLGLLRKRGYTVRFAEFMRIGIPVTVAAVPAACVFVWWIWRR